MFPEDRQSSILFAMGSSELHPQIEALDPQAGHGYFKSQWDNQNFPYGLRIKTTIWASPCEMLLTPWRNGCVWNLGTLIIHWFMVHHHFPRPPKINGQRFFREIPWEILLKFSSHCAIVVLSGWLQEWLQAGGSQVHLAPLAPGLVTCRWS